MKLCTLLLSVFMLIVLSACRKDKGLPSPTITNKIPLANAGQDQIFGRPIAGVMLKGSGYDADGKIVAYSWRKISGPQGFSIADSTSAITTVSLLEYGVYEMELKVTDDQNASTNDTINLVVTDVIGDPGIGSWDY